MAEAGFYYCPSDGNPDLVLCYVCNKELDGWDPDDDPWAEHLSHSPNCAFIKLGKKMADMTLSDFLKLEAARCRMYIDKCVESTKEQLVAEAAKAKGIIVKLK